MAYNYNAPGASDESWMDNDGANVPSSESPEDISEDVKAAQDGEAVLPAQSAGYQGPEDGPFRCDNCTFFKGDNAPCEKVSDPIQAGGCCYLFKNGNAQEGNPVDERKADQYAAAKALISNANGPAGAFAGAQGGQF